MTTFATVPDKAAGDVFTEALWDTYIKTNLNSAVVVKLAETVLGADTASIDITSIPQTHTHLLITGMLRGTQAAAFTGAQVRFNNDSGSNYDQQDCRGNAGTAAGFEAFAGSAAGFGNACSANAPASVFSPFQIHLPYYTNTAMNKAYVSQLGLKQGTSTGNLIIYQNAGFWRNSSAINRITIFPGANNWKSGSIVTIYGCP